MKNKKLSNFQKEKMGEMIGNGLSTSFVQYAIKNTELTMAKSIAAEIGLSFCSVEQILKTYHQERSTLLELEDKAVVQLIETVVATPDLSTQEGLFEPISNPNLIA